MSLCWNDNWTEQESMLHDKSFLKISGGDGIIFER